MPKKSKSADQRQMPAAPVGAMPTSPQIEIQCCWISPLVERPQTKKVANSTQNTEVLLALAQRDQRRGQQFDQPAALRRRRGDVGAAIDRQPEIGRVVAQEQRRQNEGHGRGSMTTKRQRGAPADGLASGSRAAAGRSTGRWRCWRSSARRRGRGAFRTSGWRRSRRAPAPSCRCRRRSRRPRAPAAARVRA